MVEDYYDFGDPTKDGIFTEQQIKQRIMGEVEVKEAPLESEIRATCNNLADFLVEKNKAYGNSASEPINIFAKNLNTLDQINVRIDDKLNRIKKGAEYPGDDTIKDLIGYLILRRIVAGKGGDNV